MTCAKRKAVDSTADPPLGEGSVAGGTPQYADLSTIEIPACSDRNLNGIVQAAPTFLPAVFHSRLLLPTVCLGVIGFVPSG